MRYWKDVDNLDDAQTAKLDLVCRKLGLKPGMRLLDIGCGWGSLMKFAAEKYGVSCVGLTVSAEQAEFARLDAIEASMEIRLADYRSFNMDGREKFDRVASIGMFEHVGHKNYVSFFETSKRSVVDDGLFLLHTIGRKRRRNVIDPWFDRYIFPNGELHIWVKFPTVWTLASWSKMFTTSEPTTIKPCWHGMIGLKPLGQRLVRDTAIASIVCGGIICCVWLDASVLVRSSFGRSFFLRPESPGDTSDILSSAFS